MRIFDISVLGWIHALACLVAIPVGFAVLALTKGTARHRRLGFWYFSSMVLANLTAFGLYAPIPGIEPGFNRFHRMAVITLAALLVAYAGARRQREALWAYLHPTGMIVSYYLLIGGAINEAFTRADALQAFHGPALGMTQGVNMLIFVVLLINMLAHVARQRARIRSVAAA